MNYNKLIFTILLSICSLGLYGQYGTTSGGGNFNSSGDYALSYSIGEVVNIQSVNSSYSHKVGILQPVPGIVSNINFEPKIDINLYPNPATEFIRIDIQDHNDLSYNIYDVQGKILLRGLLKDQIINISELHDGVYILTLQSNDYLVTEKFQKYKSN